MKAKYTIKIDNSAPPITLEQALELGIGMDAGIAGQVAVEDIVEFSRNLGHEVVHWTIQTSITFFTFSASRQMRYGPMTKKILIEGYMEPKSGLMMVRSKVRRARSQFHYWTVPNEFTLVSDVVSGAILGEGIEPVYDFKVLDGSAVEEALTQVREEGAALLVRRAAAPLELPPETDQTLGTELSLI